jgi:hypothetical protein
MADESYRLDAVGGTSGKATVETVVPRKLDLTAGMFKGGPKGLPILVRPPKKEIPMFEDGFGDVSGDEEFDPNARHPDEMVQEWMNKENKKLNKKKKIKVLSKYGRITIHDPALSDEPLILQVTDGQCCVRPSQEELDYVKKLAAIIRKGLTE